MREEIPPPKFLLGEEKHDIRDMPMLRNEAEKQKHNIRYMSGREQPQKTAEQQKVRGNTCVHVYNVMYGEEGGRSARRAWFGGV